jgi:hypothetical protein
MMTQFARQAKWLRAAAVLPNFPAGRVETMLAGRFDELHRDE